MKGKCILLVRLTALAVLFTAAATVLRLNLIRLPEKAAPGEEEQVVSLLAAEDVMAVEWSGSGSSVFRLERGSDQKWICPDYAEDELDQEKVRRTVAALCQVVSVRRITDWKDASVYGLDPPACRVELTLADGTAVRYLIGSLNTYTNRYYFRLEEDTVIHMVGYSVGEPISFGIADYIKSK